jgi:hypothetical protein
VTALLGEGEGFRAGAARQETQGNVPLSVDLYYLEAA